MVRTGRRIKRASVALEVVPETRVVHMQNDIALARLVRPLLLEPVLAFNRAVRIPSRVAKWQHANRHRQRKIHIVQERLPVVHRGETRRGHVVWLVASVWLGGDGGAKPLRGRRRLQVPGQVRVRGRVRVRVRGRVRVRFRVRVRVSVRFSA